MQVLVGIDIGTTNIKAIAFNTLGEQQYSINKKNKIIEYDSKEDFDYAYIENTILNMLKEIKNEGFKILSIGISSLAESLVPIFAEDKFINTMVWYDRRTESLKESFINKFNSEKTFYHITGLKPNYLYSIHKLQWYQKHEPELFNKVDKWLPLNSFIGYILTGNMAIDYTMASRTGALNIKEKSWSKEIFDHLPYKKDVFPELIASGNKLGEVKDEIKDVIGIDYDIPVSLGGHDHICGSFAVIAFKDNYLLDSMGTAENILTIIDKSQLDIESYIKRNVCAGVHVIPDKYYVYKAFDYSGAVINNIASLFFNKPKEKLNKKDYEKFSKEAENHIKDDILVELFIEQNENNNKFNLKNTNILNISANTTRGEIFLGAIRYISNKAKQVIKDLEKTNKEKYNIIAIGGSTRNNVLMREKQKIINRNIYINQIDEAVTLGAALLGGLGAGFYQDYEDVIKHINRKAKEI